MIGSPVGTDVAADGRVIRAAARRCGRGGVAGMRRLPGRSHRVYECRDARGGVFIARLASPPRCRFDVESAVLERCLAAGVPVPAVLHVGEADGMAIMLQQRAPGRPIADAAGGPELVRRAGEVLAAIHAIRTTGYGPLTARLSGPAPHLGDWFVDGLADKAAAALRIDPSATDLVEEAVAVLAAHGGFLAGLPAGLLHGDFSPHNVLVHEGAVSAVIDWEAVKSGPPALDIGWWDCFFETPATRADDLIAGYERRRPLDRDVLTAVRHLCVLRVMVGHFSWTTAVGDRGGIEVARARIARELATAARWRAAP